MGKVGPSYVRERGCLVTRVIFYLEFMNGESAVKITL